MVKINYYMGKEEDMFNLSMEKLKKQNAIKTILLLYFAIIPALFLAACHNEVSTETAVPAEQETIKVTIKTPSDIESTIAPGRHFKVSGSLSGEIPDDAILKVALLDAAGNEMRYAAADQKGTDRVDPSVMEGDITVFNKSTDFSEVAYTAPELVVSDKSNPYESVHSHLLFKLIVRGV